MHRIDANPSLCAVVVLLFGTCQLPAVTFCVVPNLLQIQEVQHKRFEFVAVQRDLRRLLHVAMATDEQLRTQQLSDDSTWHLEGQLRYSGCMYATAKVLDRVTAVARCALEVKTRL